MFARYVLEGLREGFRIGFTPASTLSPAPSNMQSARLHPTVISDYISKEVEEGRMFGPKVASDTKAWPGLLNLSSYTAYGVLG